MVSRLYVDTPCRRRGVYLNHRNGKGASVDPSQIAKDLSFLGIRGKTRIDIASTSPKAHSAILGFGRRHNAIMMGAGSLGAALIADSGLPALRPQHRGRHRHKPRPHRHDNQRRRDTRPREHPRPRGSAQGVIGIIAVPVDSAQSASDTLSLPPAYALYGISLPRAYAYPKAASSPTRRSIHISP